MRKILKSLSLVLKLVCHLSRENLTSIAGITFRLEEYAENRLYQLKIMLYRIYPTVYDFPLGNDQNRKPKIQNGMSLSQAF